MEDGGMGIIASRNLDNQRREKNGIVYFDRGTITGKNGRKYDRYAIQTHFVQRGESQEELVRKYVLPLSQPGDVLSFGAKVMCMCVESVKTKDEVSPASGQTSCGALRASTTRV
jgi:predicted RNA-binding protein with PIN domain